jgi:hypothetical protein
VSSAEHERLLRRARAQDVALFRYRLIGPALEEGLSAKQRGRVVRGIAGQVHAGPGGRAVQVSRKTIDTWIRAWRRGEFEALLPGDRKCEPVTAESVLAMAAALKRENMGRTAAQVRRIMVAQAGDAPSERTLQRHFAREDLVPLENRILGRELRLLGCQAARMYSLIRPFRTGFRRIWRAWKCPAVMQGGWCSASGTCWPIPWCGRAVL